MRNNSRNQDGFGSDFSVPCPPPFPINQLPYVKSNSFRENELDTLEKAVLRLTSAEPYLQAEPFYAYNTNLQSQLQIGPKCGLVALSIATSNTNDFKPVETLLTEALNNGYTSHGEIFSCLNLCNLVENMTAFKPFLIDGGLNFHINCIINCLQSGGLMLVPYDADYNHSPCCKKGHSAHWAVMSGIVILRVSDSESEDCVSDEDDNALVLGPNRFQFCECVQNDREQFFATKPNVKIIRDNNNSYIIRGEGSDIGSRKGKIYLAGKHGKSRHLNLWWFDQLAESNDNLMFLSEKHKLKNFVLPEGGVAGGLKGKAILLKSIC